MYKLIKLPFLLGDLEPYIDIHTVGLHYYKHHKNYLKKLNELLKKNNYDYQYSIEKLVFHLDNFSKDDYDDILFNLGGVLNHNLYWMGIRPNQSRLESQPTGKLKDALNEKFGCFEKFWNLFKEKALSLKGSGYTVLGIKKDGELEIVNIFNQDIPLLQGIIPLFIIDVWEHAYYLNYENERVRYLDNFLEIADFTYASEVYNNIFV